MSSESSDRPDGKPTSANETKTPRPSGEIKPTDSAIISAADALYEQGMAHYRRREWHKAREVFTRIKRLQPDRRGIDALLDEIDIFIRLQAMEPGAPAAEASSEAAVRRQDDITARSAAATVVKPKRGFPWRLVIIIVLVGAVVALYLLTKIPRENEAQRLFNLGQAYYNSGIYDKSVESLESFLAMSPTANAREAEALLEKARPLAEIQRHYAEYEAVARQENWEAAVTELQLVQARCQKLGYVADPQIRSRCEATNTALPALVRRAQLANLFAEGRAQIDAQQWAKAADIFQRLRGIDPTYRSADVSNYLFVAYLNYGEELVEVAGNATDQVELAIDLFERAAQLRPEDARAADDASSAKTYLAALRAFHASNWEALRAYLQRLYEKRSDYAGGRAASLLCKAYLELGNEAYGKGDKEGALGFYRQALQIKECDHTEAEVLEHKVFVELYPPTATATVTPTETPTPTITDTPLPTDTPSPTSTPQPTNTPTRTPVPPTSTPTPLPPPTHTPLPPPTPVPPTSTPLPPPTR